MLMDDCVVCRVLLEKKIVGLLVCDLFICNWKRGKNDYEIVFDFFFKKKIENYFEKGRGLGYKGIWIFKNEGVWRYLNEYLSDVF